MIRQSIDGVIGTLCCIAGWVLMGAAGCIYGIGRLHGPVVRAADRLFIRAFDLGSR